MAFHREQPGPEVAVASSIEKRFEAHSAPVMDLSAWRGRTAGRKDESPASIMPDNELHVVQAIAAAEATVMWQVPCLVHCLAACIYRLQEAGPQLSHLLGVSVLDVRRWAADNLRSAWPGGNGRYSGPLDYAYEVRQEGSRVAVVIHSQQQVERYLNGTGEHRFHDTGESWESARKKGEVAQFAFTGRVMSVVGEGATAMEIWRVALAMLSREEEMRKCLDDLGLPRDDLMGGARL